MEETKNNTTTTTKCTQNEQNNKLNPLRDADTAIKIQQDTKKRIEEEKKWIASTLTQHQFRLEHRPVTTRKCYKKRQHDKKR